MLSATPKRGLMAVSTTAAGKVSGPHAGRKREPGERFEFVIEEEGGDAAGGMLGVGNGRAAAVGKVRISVGRAIEEHATWESSR